jgi:hypothetical protein
MLSSLLPLQSLYSTNSTGVGTSVVVVETDVVDTVVVVEEIVAEVVVFVVSVTVVAVRVLEIEVLVCVCVALVCVEDVVQELHIPGQKASMKRLVHNVCGKFAHDGGSGSPLHNGVVVDVVVRVVVVVVVVVVRVVLEMVVLVPDVMVAV